MKRLLYLALFALLGLTFQLGVHAVIETAYIVLLLTNFSIFGLGLSWSAWFTVHKVFTAALVCLGLVGGVSLGAYWWPKLYDERGELRKLPW